MSRTVLLLALLPGGFIVLAALGIIAPSLRQAWLDLGRRAALRAANLAGRARRWLRVWLALRDARHTTTVVYLRRPVGLVSEPVGYCARCGHGWYAFDGSVALETCPTCGEELL